MRLYADGEVSTVPISQIAIEPKMRQVPGFASRMRREEENDECGDMTYKKALEQKHCSCYSSR